MVDDKNIERFEFKSEAQQLLDLMIHSLYSNKDVFLRELISNASDAMDKRRFEALTEPSLLSADTTFEIRIHTDSDERTVTIEDNGIGMSRDDLIADLGTIARSGTKDFVNDLKDAEETGELDALIGQFGVGFYSAFMAASSISVTSRKAGTDEAWCFESSGDGGFGISEAERDTAGTTIVLQLLPADPENNLPDFTEEWTLKSTIKKYSDFIQHPILQKTTKTEYEKDDEGQIKEGGKSWETEEWVTVNSMKAIWTRPQSEVEEEEYTEFYKHITHDWTEPLDKIVFRAEGMFEYYALLYLPGRPPVDLYYRDGRFGMRLHSNRVLIMEECQDLLPDYLRFVKGVVDSPDLSLNVSREMLQHDRKVGQIRKRLTKKILDRLEFLMGDDAEKYAEFWEAFGKVLKEGVVSDFDHRSKLEKLLWFHSSKTEVLGALDPEAEGEDKPKRSTQYTSLTDYIERMSDEQEAIYYITGDSREAVERSPHLEAFFEKGYEVLFLIDPYDEVMIGSLREVDGKPLQAVGKGVIELGSEEEKKAAKESLEEKEKEHKPLLDFIQSTLEEHVKEVRLSTRLTRSAACLVGEEGDYSPHFQRLLERAGQPMVADVKRILEVNPNHPLLEKLQSRYEADGADPILEKHVRLIHGQALLSEGSPLSDPVEFSRLVAELMVDSL